MEIFFTGLICIVFLILLGLCFYNEFKSAREYRQTLISVRRSLEDIVTILSEKNI